MGGQPELRATLFDGYRQVIYYTHQGDDRLVRHATEIAEQLGLPLTIEVVGFGELESRLVTIMESNPQAPSSSGQLSSTP